jgi:hypothetical protein
VEHRYNGDRNNIASMDGAVECVLVDVHVTHAREAAGIVGGSLEMSRIMLMVLSLSIVGSKRRVCIDLEAVFRPSAPLAIS